MQHPLALASGVLGVAAVLGTLALPPRPTTPPPPNGHLVLVIEGDAKGLEVTHVTAKADPYNRVYGPKTSHEIALFDRNGTELGRYPLDLSKFDLDPANVGKPVRSEGCTIIESKVVMLTNIPWLPNTSYLEIRRGATKVGELTVANYSRLVGAAAETLERQR